MHPESHVMLREHFRCVAPIIQFSTRFYNNALVPLRVPKASERFDPPLVDVYIPGAARQSKTNPYEARWIVDEIAKIIDDPTHNGRDIGVISLIGGEQAEKIGRMLVEDERIGPEKIEERRIIYGDARTMQGQERSIVFLSMVATPGRVTSQSSKPDQQRINVAMSRGSGPTLPRSFRRPRGSEAHRYQGGYPPPLRRPDAEWPGRNRHRKRRPHGTAATAVLSAKCWAVSSRQTTVSTRRSRPVDSPSISWSRVMKIVVSPSNSTETNITGPKSGTGTWRARPRSNAPAGPSGASSAASGMPRKSSGGKTLSRRSIE